jgi:hypothetical protein
MGNSNTFEIDIRNSFFLFQIRIWHTICMSILIGSTRICYKNSLIRLNSTLRLCQIHLFVSKTRSNIKIWNKPNVLGIFFSDTFNFYLTIKKKFIGQIFLNSEIFWFKVCMFFTFFMHFFIDKSVNSLS